MKRQPWIAATALTLVLTLTLSIVGSVAAQSDVTYATYIVQPQDRLAKIARQFCTTWEEIYNLNRDSIGPNPNELKPGMSLTVPNRCGGPVGSGGPVYDRGPSLHANGTIVGNVYTVAPGDTLFSIARRFGVPQTELARVNGLNSPKDLKYGQKLIIPGLAAPGPSTSWDLAPGQCQITPQPGAPSFDFPGGPQKGQFVASGTWSATKGARLSGQTWYMIDVEPGTGNPPDWVRDRDVAKSGNCGPSAPVPPPSSSATHDFAPGDCLITPRPGAPIFEFPGGPQRGEFVASGTWSAIKGARMPDGSIWYMVDTEPGSGNPPDWVRDLDAAKGGNCSW